MSLPPREGAAEPATFVYALISYSVHQRTQEIGIRMAIGATALYIQRQNDATPIALTLLARLIDWRQLLVVVRPETLVRWQERKRFGTDCRTWCARQGSIL